MRTWEEYKKHVRTVEPEIAKDIDEAEKFSEIISAAISRKNKKKPLTYFKKGNDHI